MASLSHISTKNKAKLGIPNSRHLAALGRFVEQCSSLEISLSLVLRRMLKINPTLARAIIGIGDPRVTDLITLIKRVSKINKPSHSAGIKLQNMLAWANYMNSVRSVVAHKPMYVKGVVMCFHNANTAKSEEVKFVYRCSTHQMNDLSDIGYRVCVGLHAMPNPLVFPNLDWNRLSIPDVPPDASFLQKQKLPDRPQTQR